MSVVVKGLAETRAALRKLEPDLLKESDKAMRGVLMGIVKDARGFVPGESPLSGWSAGTNSNSRKITTNTSQFAKKNNRSFPTFNAGQIRAGITQRIGRAKPSRSGFTAIYAILNKSAAGAIYETAGRINKGGQPWGGPKAPKSDHRVSHSINPSAGSQFIDKIDKQDGQRPISGKREGRLAFRAVEQDSGKAINAILESTKVATAKCNARLAVSPTLGGAR